MSLYCSNCYVFCYTFMASSLSLTTTVFEVGTQIPASCHMTVSHVVAVTVTSFTYP